MDKRDFIRRIAAIGTESVAVPACRDVLVNGMGLRPAAARHGVDAAQVQRLCRRIKGAAICEACGQEMKGSET